MENRDSVVLMEKQVSSEELFRGRVVHLFRDEVELPNGKITTREVVRHPGAVAVVPLTKENEVVMVRQYRYPFARPMLEVPAGKIDPGEEPLHAAIRELSEETGIEAKELRYLGEYLASVAIFDERIHLYLARDLTFFEQHTDPDEFLQVERIPLDELLASIMEGAICDGKTQVALLKTQRILDAEK